MALCYRLRGSMRLLQNLQQSSDRGLGFLLQTRPTPAKTLSPFPSKWRPFSSSPLVGDSSGSDAESSFPVDVGTAEDIISSSYQVSQHIEGGSTGIHDLTALCLDYLHNFTGLPWWATISMSAIALRSMLLPLRIMQTKKVEEIKKLGSKLRLEQLARGAFQGRFFEEFRSLRKRKLECNSPSLFWLIGPGIFIQIPVVLMIMYSLRKMALEQHIGFATGGMLWFNDLTVPGDGLTGTILPLIIAGSYFANTHILFQGRPVRQGPYGTFLKVWENVLKCSTCFIFLSFYHVPQATHMFFVPHSIMTLAQTRVFEHEKVTKKDVKNQSFQLKDPFISSPKKAAELSVYEQLLKDAGTQFSSGNIPKAIEVLKNAIKQEPEEDQAYALLGLVYKTQQDWVNSAFYYQHAISKGKTDDFKIAAYAGCGLALLKQGSVNECVETMRAIRRFEVPTHPQAKHLYYASLIILGRALSEAGLDEESKEVKVLAQQLKPDNFK